MTNNLQITLNLHPADGVPAYEDRYPALAEFLGRDPQSKETIRWQSSDRRFMRGWLDKMLKPLEDEGVPKKEHTIVVKYSAERQQNLATGMIGKMRRVANTMTAMKFRNAGINYIEGFGELGSAAQMLEYYPERFNEIINDFNQNYYRLPELIDKQGMGETDRLWFLKKCQR